MWGASFLSVTLGLCAHTHISLEERMHPLHKLEFPYASH